MRLKFAFSLIIVAVVFLSHAQNLKFDHITANDGLGDNFVRRVFEDSYGFVWICTKDGLSRYDGYDMKTYKSNPANPHSLSSSYVADIKEDENGNLWIGSGNGLSFYNREYDRFTNYSLGGAKKNEIFELEQDSIYLWIASESGLCKFNTETKKYKWFFSDKLQKGYDLNYTRILRLQKGPDNHIWLAFANKNGLIKFNPITEEFTQYCNKMHSTTSTNGISELLFTDDSTLLIGCMDNGVMKMNIKTQSFSMLDDSQALTENGLKMIWFLQQDSQKNIWIGSINGGLFLYDSTYTFKKNVIPDVSNPTGISSLSISSIIEDKHGNLWFGTHGGGVDILNKRKNIFKHYKKTSNQQSISHNFVSSFYETDSGKIWIGTDGGGLNYLNRNTNDYKHFSVKNALSSNAVLSINPYDEDNIAVSTWEGGVVIFNTTDYSSRFLQFDETNPNSLNYTYLKDAFRKGDSLYVATHSIGLNIYDVVNDEFNHASNDSSLAYLSTIGAGNKIISDSNGDIWVATTSGLFRMRDSMINTYLPDTSDASSISGKYITDLYIDSKNRLWCGTLKGLNLYNRLDDSFIKFDKHPELLNAIMSICEDNYGNLWCGSNAGLIKYNYQTGDVATFNKTDGLQDNQFFERAAYKDSEGNMYFGGMNGFNTFDPTEIVTDTSEPIIFFNDFKIFYKSQVPSADNTLLQKHINFTDELSINYSQKIITFEFTALHKLASSKNEYRYILEGFDDTWYDIGTDQFATYTNLSPGTYTFKVKACNGDKVWAKKSKEIRVHILPPWWMTWWFRALIAVFSVSVVVLVFYVRIRNIKRINRILEEKVTLRTAELTKSKEDLEEHKEELITKNEKLTDTINTKDRFFSIIAHDLKNPLNAMLGFSDLLMSNWNKIDEPKKQKFIGVINSSSNLLFSLLNNLLDWSRSQTGSIQVNYEMLKLVPLLEENLLLLKGQAENKQIRLTKTVADDLVVFADKNMLDTILRNLISNAIKYTPKNGKINASAISNGNGTVNISIADNGVGMTQKQIDSLFKVDKNSSTPGTEKEQGTGLGLLVCYEFVRNNNGTISVESTIEEGTTFTVTLPMSK